MLLDFLSAALTLLDVRTFRYAYLRSLPHIEEDHWCATSEDEIARIAKTFMLLPRVAEAKEAFSCYSAQFAAVTMHAKVGQDSDDVANVVLTGLQLLSHWTAAVVEQFTWKFTHPCDRCVVIAIDGWRLLSHM